jgi:hypothetical protein
MKAQINDPQRGHVILNAPALPRKLPERDFTPIWVKNKITGKVKSVPTWMESQFASLHLEKCDPPEPEKSKKSKKDPEKNPQPQDPVPVQPVQ